MSSAVLKFLSLVIICIVIIDGVLCHEEGKTPTTSTTSGDSEGLSTDLLVALGVGIVTLATIILVSCCTKKRRNNQIQGTKDALTVQTANVNASKNGRYYYIEVLGRGGFGAVLKAQDQVQGRKVAVKIIQSEKSLKQSVLRHQQPLKTGRRRQTC